MKRDLLQHLLAWCSDQFRKPLIIRGARQVGKSWIVRELGKTFQSFVEINFEKDKSAKHWFEGDLNITSIVNYLGLHTNTKIEPGKTLLFLDEIQACQPAIQSLRYFKEELPELHVIAAGSLIDFALDQIGIPVGRVQYMYLYPLSFAEYLTINGRDDFRNYIKSQQNDEVIHQQILAYLREYVWLGGMPAVNDAWLKTKDFAACQKIQDELIEVYRDDFHRYAKDRQIEHISKIFENIPLQFGQKFKYTTVDQDTRVYLLKEALTLLSKAGIAHYCYHTGGQRQPLGAMTDPKKFKLFFLDIGLALRLLNFDIKQWLLKPLQINNHGAIAEQFVAQELIAYSQPHKQSQLYYWHREAKSSNAEVDFLCLKNGVVIPIEVKASTKGQMKSINLFLQSHPESDYGLKISQGQFMKHGNLQEIPLYALEAWLNDTK